MRREHRRLELVKHTAYYVEHVLVVPGERMNHLCNVLHERLRRQSAQRVRCQLTHIPASVLEPV